MSAVALRWAVLFKGTQPLSRQRGPELVPPAPWQAEDQAFKLVLNVRTGLLPNEGRMPCTSASTNP